MMEAPAGTRQAGGHGPREGDRHDARPSVPASDTLSPPSASASDTLSPEFGDTAASLFPPGATTPFDEDADDADSTARLELADLIVRRQRLRQLCGLLLVALAVTAITSALGADWTTFTLLAAGFAVVAAGGLLNDRGATTAAGRLILWTLAAVATTAMWFNQGLYSPAILAYPCVLLISTMLVGGRNFVALALAMVACLAFMTLAGVRGWHAFSIAPFGFAQFAYAGVVLVASAVASRVLGEDLRRATTRWRQEVTRVNASRRRLAYLARHDALTELPNRWLGERRLGRAIASASRRQGRVALMRIDVDNFKSVNDSLGHATGDAVLKEAARRLKSEVADADCIARQGGDEFLAVLAVDDVGGIGAAEAASRVLKSLAQPFDVGERSVVTSCSIGIALFPEDGGDAASLLQRADIAVRHAKDAGRNVSRFFDDAMNADMLEDLSINTGLRLALARREFRLWYQPVVDLASGRLLGAEALLRWEHPEKGLVLPARFIPAAERSGLIVDIGHWVLDEACRQLSSWRGTPLAHLVVSVNTSGVQFKRGTIDTVVARALEAHGTPPGCLEIEITESALIHDAEALVSTLQRLKALGVRLAIDDFGTGYSNLSYLQRFEIDTLKIDQSFVRRLVSTRRDSAIAQAIVQMAHSLDLQTTAEGVEDEATRDALVALGCDQGQGWYFGRPQPIEQFEALCRAQGAGATGP
jgi:diguanylate cyclase (GGDEF)-like protein